MHVTNPTKRNMRLLTQYDCSTVVLLRPTQAIVHIIREDGRTTRLTLNDRERRQLITDLGGGYQLPLLHRQETDD